jgi:hypothetical protein
MRSELRFGVMGVMADEGRGNTLDAAGDAARPVVATGVRRAGLVNLRANLFEKNSKYDSECFDHVMLSHQETPDAS